MKRSNRLMVLSIVIAVMLVAGYLAVAVIREPGKKLVAGRIEPTYEMTLRTILLGPNEGIYLAGGDDFDALTWRSTPACLSSTPSTASAGAGSMSRPARSPLNLRRLAHGRQ
jgi:hypothetical protein